MIRSAKRIIVSISTISWWAAWLSNALEIYLPRPNYGTWKARNDGVDLYVHDEPRWRIVDVKREGTFF